MFRAHVFIIRRSKLHYTASGIITPIGGHLVHGLREDCSPLSTCTPHPCSRLKQPATRIPPQPSQTETPTHIETRTHDQCGDIIEKLQAPDDGCINVRNMLSIE